MEGSSYRRVNFGLRYAKNIERKMLAESFRRLVPFGLPEDYRYVGFGSIYFTDFILFHKVLGMRNMVSIEKDDNEDQQARFEFNKPYQCVQVEFGTSNERLPALPWDQLTILWLDYDRRLEASHLNDVGTFAAQAVPGSVLVTTVNVQPVSRGNPDLLQILREDVGEERVPLDVRKQDLTGQGLGEVSRRIMIEHIDAKLRIRNGGDPSAPKLSFRPLYYFRYRDGAMMLTFGGVLVDEELEASFEACRFFELPYIRETDEPFVLEPPNLTYRELRYLDAQLPCENDSKLSAMGIPEKDLENYASIYRFFPVFADTEI